MSKIVLILVALFSLNSVTYASFPVTENTTTTEFVVVNENQASPVGNVDFNFGGFFLGFLLGLIGVGLAYIFSDDEVFRRSAWYGLGTWVILLLILLAGAPA